MRGALDAAADSDDAVSSQGVHHLGDGADPDGFVVGGANVRRVEPRNTPSTINAVFNHRQFWDGRAENVFNGVNHLGQRDPEAKLFRADDPKKPVEVRVELTNASLASQAVAPIISALELAEEGPRVQPLRPDDQGGLSREVVEGQELDGTPIEPLGIPTLAADEVDAIVAFLETLTDERVLHQRAPFDHPQILVPNGHPGDSSSTVDADCDGMADDVMVDIPAVGAAGGDPLPGFLEGVFGPTP